ncbi:MAG: YidC/Oxa1 family insertase periplasmic-domain containing protein [Lentisphaerales bacterium]|nr:YidC/Oxa1 family insertase periplasmic-domain containing protein [Lentisphaerales bacterium]
MDKKNIGPALIFGAAFFAFFFFVGPALDEKFAPPAQVVENTEAIGDAAQGNSEKVKNLDNPSVVEKTTTEKKPVKAEVKEALTDLEAVTLSTKLFDVTVDPEEGIKQILLNDAEDEASANVMIGDETVPSLFLNGIASNWRYGQAEVQKTDSEIVISRPVIGKDLRVVQVIKLLDNYQLRTTYKFINTGDKPLNISKLGVNCGQMKPIALGDVGMMAGMDQAVDLYNKESERITSEFLADIIEEVDEAEAKDSLPRGQGKFFADQAEQGYQWISVKNRYFAWIVDVEEGFASSYMQYKSYKSKDPETGEPVDANLVSAVGVLKDFTVAANSQHEVELDCYAGPQKLDLLSELTHGKKGVMQLNLFMFWKVGWVGLISEAMLRGLLMLYGWVGSYGIAIILLTVIIKILFWRITNKSTESMKKMSALSPKMKEINEKYGDNPQVKQQKVMELYRDAGVNPVAGCLPMLLQMPVFIALFNALRGAIELRHSEFLWVADLSQPDTVFTIFGLPFRPLAIAWAVTMLIQQKLVPSSADETQKKVMMFMPVFMLFVCYGMPSGLTLYWTFSTLMSILQYYMSNKKANKQEQTTASTVTG